MYILLAHWYMVYLDFEDSCNLFMFTLIPSVIITEDNSKRVH